MKNILKHDQIIWAQYKSLVAWIQDTFKITTVHVTQNNNFEVFYFQENPSFYHLQQCTEIIIMVFRIEIFLMGINEKVILMIMLTLMTNIILDCNFIGKYKLNEYILNMLFIGLIFINGVKWIIRTRA